MATDTLKEFLVALGFKIDEGSYRKFLDSVAGATKEVNVLGITTAITESAFIGMMGKLSQAMEQLYFASQRTGSSIASIKGFNFSIANLGGSAEAAQQSLENLGHFIRSYPGSADFLMKLGVAPGHVKDSVAAMEDLQRTFQKMPFWQAQPFANMLGIDEKTLLAMQDGSIVNFQDEYNERLRQSGVDAQKAGEQGHSFMVALRGVSSELGILGQALEQNLSQPLIDVLHWIDKVLSGLALLINKPKEWATNFENTISRTTTKGYETAIAGGTAPKNLPSSQQGSWNHTVTQLEKMGWSRAQATGIAANLSAESGFNPAAMGDHNTAYGMAQWHKDRRDAFKQWSGHSMIGSSADEQLAFVNYELRSGKEQMAGRALQDADDPYSAGRIVSKLYERPAGGDSTADARGKSAATAPIVNQTTTINVTGSDPQSIASAVAARQNDVNNQLVRNVGGAVQ